MAHGRGPPRWQRPCRHGGPVGGAARPRPLDDTTPHVTAARRLSFPIRRPRRILNLASTSGSTTARQRPRGEAAGRLISIGCGAFRNGKAATPWGIEGPGSPPPSLLARHVGPGRMTVSRARVYGEGKTEKEAGVWRDGVDDDRGADVEVGSRCKSSPTSHGGRGS